MPESSPTNPPCGPAGQADASFPRTRAARITLFLLPLLAFAVFLSVKFSSPNVYAWLVKEDSVVENVEAVALLAASLIALTVSRQLRKQGLAVEAALYLLGAVGLLFVFGEEISWGQRLLGLPTPAFLTRYNQQNEITLHNLRGGSYVTAVGYIVVGTLGAIGWRLAPWVLRGRVETWLAAPGWYLSPYFFFVAATYAALPLAQHVGYELLGIEWLRRGVLLGWNDGEPPELLLALGILLFVLAVRSRLRRPHSMVRGSRTITA